MFLQLTKKYKVIFLMLIKDQTTYSSLIDLKLFLNYPENSYLATFDSY